ncbi:AMIN domain-containing protein [Tissierella creatinini]|nr:AMIN domain-containing protein [Tissierella creatinini]TJX62928.1 AMIN domain-containing protein [Soehngenia saccharolytica]
MITCEEAKKEVLRMKRWFILISLLISILLFSSMTYAANNIIHVSMNGSNVKVKEVPVLMNGQAIISEVPSFVYVDRTLVPIRFVAEGFGAEVKWDQATKTATVLHDNKVVKLTIDSNKVVVNNSKKVLDNNSIPKLVTFSNKDSRTMVPVRFISEVLGYDVSWDDINQIAYINSNSTGKDIEVIDLNPEVNEPKETEKPEVPIKPEKPKVEEPTLPAAGASITGINVLKGSTSNNTVEIKSNQPISYDALFLPDSNKLVIDIEDAVLNISGKAGQVGEILVNDQDFNRVTYSQYDTSPYVTRIVVELKGRLDYEFYTTEDGKTTTLAINDNEFNGIEVDMVDGKEALVIDGVGQVKYNVMKLKSPERIVVDLMDTNLGNKTTSYDIKTGFIKGVRVSQFGGDNNYKPGDRIVRIVMDIVDGVESPEIKVEADGDRLVIYPEKSIWEFINYDNSQSIRQLTINNNNRTIYDVSYNSDDKTMKIVIPKEDTQLREGYSPIKDGFMEDIKIAETNDDVIISIKFRKAIVYGVLSDSKAEEIVLSLQKDPNAINDYTIVLDPGHGGKDPGAISPNGTKEKDVNLIIGLKTRDKLEALKYDVIMTRTNDTFIDLYERARIANQNNADIFISIHHNSALNNGVRGLEILYCPRGQGTAKVDDQYPLAESISKGIIETTKGNDRGIKQRSDLVVIRNTNMSAVLIEVGYLSNASDEANIVSDAYQNKVVEGIILGIQNYFDMY